MTEDLEDDPVMDILAGVMDELTEEESFLLEIDNARMLEHAPLVSLKEYKRLDPFAQGYSVYMEASRPGSELAGLVNPYGRTTRRFAAWQNGWESAKAIAGEANK